MNYTDPDLPTNQEELNLSLDLEIYDPWKPEPEPLDVEQLLRGFIANEIDGLKTKNLTGYIKLLMDRAGRVEIKKVISENIKNYLIEDFNIDPKNHPGVIEAIYKLFQVKCERLLTEIEERYFCKQKIS